MSKEMRKVAMLTIFEARTFQEEETEYRGVGVEAQGACWNSRVQALWSAGRNGVNREEVGGDEVMER